MKIHKIAYAAFAALLCTGVASATTSTLNLSTHSSGLVDPSALSATFTFAIVSGQLELTVVNGTDDSGGEGFNIVEIYFNFDRSVVASLAIDTVIEDGTNDRTSAWTQHDDGDSGNPTMADGFGKFDIAMKDGQGEFDVNTIMPGESYVFLFDITLVGGDLATSKSFAPFFSSTDMFFAAAKFESGGPGNEDSDFGAVGIPLPAPVFLGAIGLGAVAFLRRRKF